MTANPQLLQMQHARAFIRLLYFIVYSWPYQEGAAVMPEALPLLQQVQRCVSMLLTCPDADAFFHARSSAVSDAIWLSCCFDEELAQLSTGALLVRLQAGLAQHVEHMLGQWQWVLQYGQGAAAVAVVTADHDSQQMRLLAAEELAEACMQVLAGICCCWHKQISQQQQQQQGAHQQQQQQQQSLLPLQASHLPRRPLQLQSRHVALPVILQRTQAGESCSAAAGAAADASSGAAGAVVGASPAAGPSEAAAAPTPAAGDAASAASPPAAAAPASTSGWAAYTQAWQDMMSWRLSTHGSSQYSSSTLWFLGEASAAVQVLLQHVKVTAVQEGGSCAVSPAAVQLTVDALLLQYWQLQLLEQHQQQHCGANEAEIQNRMLAGNVKEADDHRLELQLLLDAQLAAAAAAACQTAAAGTALPGQRWPWRKVLLVSLLQAQRAAAAAAARYADDGDDDADADADEVVDGDNDTASKLDVAKLLVHRLSHVVSFTSGVNDTTRLCACMLMKHVTPTYNSEPQVRSHGTPIGLIRNRSSWNH
jgi:hypothetical protein